MRSNKFMRISCVCVTLFKYFLIITHRFKLKPYLNATGDTLEYFFSPLVDNVMATLDLCFAHTYIFSTHLFFFLSLNSYQTNIFCNFIFERHLIIR